MKKEYIALILVLIIVLVTLGLFILYNQWPLITGKKVVLATHPVDPFGLLRGQYMTINYEISNIKKINGIKARDIVYVSLKEDSEGVWRMDKISRVKPKIGDFIKGIVIRDNRNSLRIEYGIEQYFFERNAKVPTTNITVEVSIADSGRAKIIQLLQNGKPMKIEYEKFNIRA